MKSNARACYLLLVCLQFASQISNDIGLCVRNTPATNADSQQWQPAKSVRCPFGEIPTENWSVFC